MSGDDKKLLESWEHVAQQASKEKDPEKLAKLASTLIQKLDEVTKHPAGERVHATKKAA